MDWDSEIMASPGVHGHEVWSVTSEDCIVWVWVHIVWDSEFDYLASPGACSWSVGSGVRGPVSLSGCEYTLIGTVTVWHHLVYGHEVWAVTSEDQFHCLGVSTHCLGQWLSDITWCMVMKCGLWRQRTSFIVWVWVHIVLDSDCLTSLGVWSWSVGCDVRGPVSLSGCEYTLFGTVSVWHHLVYGHEVWAVTSDSPFHCPGLCIIYTSHQNGYCFTEIIYLTSKWWLHDYFIRRVTLVRRQITSCSNTIHPTSNTDKSHLRIIRRCQQQAVDVHTAWNGDTSYWPTMAAHCHSGTRRGSQKTTLAMVTNKYFDMVVHVCTKFTPSSPFLMTGVIAMASSIFFHILQLVVYIGLLELIL